ncbi:MAG TPA: ketoacyl-ACP synthase III [Candidatus Treponema faecavium]|nr:ketoacyl-ACP synthase III [Candidatus Treponema faecavium]
MAVVIRGTGNAVPAQKMPNEALDEKLETSDEWIRSHTGIGSRYVAAQDETSSVLGARACQKALEQAGVSADAVDLIVCATATPDYQGFPATACLIQAKLGAVKAAAFDVSAACSGFIYALESAAGLLERRGWRYALVCGAETLTRIVDWSDRSTCVLFGDGAGAVLVERTADDSRQKGIGEVILGADGAGGGELFIDEQRHIRMNGRAVYTFAVRVLSETVERLLEKEGLSIDDVDLVVCHQANSRILAAAAKRLGIDSAKIVNNMEEYGNTSAASIPITYADLVAQGRLREGMTIISAGFGAGLTWGGCVIRW